MVPHGTGLCEAACGNTGKGPCVTSQASHKSQCPLFSIVFRGLHQSCLAGSCPCQDSSRLSARQRRIGRAGNDPLSLSSVKEVVPTHQGSPRPPAIPVSIRSQLRMRPVLRRHSRRGLVGGSTFRRTPISRSPLDKKFPSVCVHTHICIKKKKKNKKQPPIESFMLGKLILWLVRNSIFSCILIIVYKT